ncbi:MAG TPA: hypothetical protein VJS64_02570 [Pyrinomonadaceae bacterium]|nr:hypothetical protein [Pyrinomonadaceae bacterium]
MKVTTLGRILVLMLSSLAFCMACSKSDASKPSTNQQAMAGSQSTDGSTSPTSSPAEPASTISDAATARKKIDVCTLLTSPEIQSIQGESLQQTKASGGVEGGFNVSQCFYALPTFVKSINLVITQRAEGAGGRDPREFWEETFDRESEQERERERDKRSKQDDKDARGRSREEEEEERAAPPEKIEGLGDEAFWTGGRVGGALYVLKGNAFLRVTVGDSGNQETNINKSKALARLALKRF